MYIPMSVILKLQNGHLQVYFMLIYIYIVINVTRDKISVLKWCYFYNYKTPLVCTSGDIRAHDNMYIKPCSTYKYYPQNKLIHLYIYLFVLVSDLPLLVCITDTALSL
jgi:hypothetical protein